MLQVRVIRPGASPQVMSVPKDVAVIGRAPDCDVVIDDPEVSRRHTRVIQGLVAIDLGSRNGTWVNEQKISEPSLVGSRRLRIGQGERAIDVLFEGAGAAPEPADFGEMTIGAGSASPVAAVRAPAPPAAAVPAGAAAGAPAGDALVRGELETERRKSSQLARQLEEMRRESEGKRSAVASQLAEARLEVLRLNQRLGSMKSEVDAGAKEGSEAVQARHLQQKLDTVEQQNAALRKHVLELEAQAKNPGAAAPQVPMAEFVSNMQRELLKLRQENQSLKERAGAAPAAMSAPMPSPIAPAAAAPAPRMAAPSRSTPSLLPSLAESDLENAEPPLAADLDGFVLFVAVRFLRAVEKVVTRIAREFVEVLEMVTMLPAAELNFRNRLSALLAAPQDVAARRALDGYLRDLSRWLVAVLGAHKQAAKEFAFGLKKALSEDALTANNPIPALKKFAGQKEAELWKRATQHLNELTPDVLDDRIGKLARETAQRMLEGKGE